MSTSQDQSQQQAKTQKTVKKLVLVVFAMFGFGFALVPLYDVFCDITGLNGRIYQKSPENAQALSGQNLVAPLTQAQQNNTSTQAARSYSVSVTMMACLI